MTKTSPLGLGLNTLDSTAWFGKAPTHAVWDAQLQMFSFTPTECAQAPDTNGIQTIIDSLYTTLSLPPKARQPQGKGYVVRPAMRVACPACGSENLSVPVEVFLNPKGIFEAWFRTGHCHCSCGYTGTKAKIKHLNMYEYIELVQTRPDYGQAILERLKKHTTLPNTQQPT
jgi:hypothetical protein